VKKIIILDLTFDISLHFNIIIIFLAYQASILTAWRSKLRSKCSVINNGLPIIGIPVQAYFWYITYIILSYI